VEYFLEPNEFFVGDHVQLYFCIPEGASYEDFSIDKIKQNTSITINDISISKINNKTYLKLDFIPWEVGVLSFPSLKEIGINFELPYIEVSSVLELDKTTSLQEARPPLLLPGTTYLIYGYAISFFFICVLGVGFVIWIRKKQKSIINKLSKRYSMFIFHFELKRLKAKLKNRDAFSKVRKNWTKKYETSFRLFLSHMYKDKGCWDSLTYNEIVEEIKEPNNEVLSLIKSLFQNLSLARFANINDEEIEKKIIEQSFQLLKLYK
jgi:hypothetical protein